MMISVCFLVIGLQIPIASEGVVDNDIAFSEETFFNISPEMKAYLDKRVLAHASVYGKFNALVTCMFDEGGLGMTYSNNRTTAPVETFNLRHGNCLSFTAMFMAMARYCGFDCIFQEVYDLNSWTQKGELTVFNRHMNCVLILDGRRKEIDFNYAGKRMSRFVSLVPDRRGIAHFFNNLGAEELSLRNNYKAKIYFEKAVETDPSFSYGWTNLGVLYRLNHEYKMAESCYKKAAHLNKLDHTPYMNLAHLFQAQGKNIQAERFRSKARKFQEKNPFYHYGLGQKAYDRGDYKAAVDHLKESVKLNDTHPKFMLSLAAAYQKTGRDQEATALIAKAQKQAETYEEKALYDKKLQLLAGSRKGSK